MSNVGWWQTTCQHPFNILWSRNWSELCNYAGHTYTGSSKMSYASQSSSPDISPIVCSDRGYDHPSGLGVAMTKTVEAKEIPYFIKVAGCNNCKVFKSYTSLSGTEYGQDHTLHAKCVHMGCDRYGHNVLAPFITPMEYLRIGLNTGLRKQAVAKTKKVIARFGEFYDHRGRLKPWVVETLSTEKDNAQ
jgi:hypothetical protein